MTLDERKAAAQVEFDKVTREPPSRQALRSFLSKRADNFFSEKFPKVPRKERREHARQLSKRLTKQTMEEWRTKNANV